MVASSRWSTSTPVGSSDFDPARGYQPRGLHEPPQQRCQQVGVDRHGRRGVGGLARQAAVVTTDPPGALVGGDQRVADGDGGRTVAERGARRDHRGHVQDPDPDAVLGRGGPQATAVVEHPLDRCPRIGPLSRELAGEPAFEQPPQQQCLHPRIDAEQVTQFDLVGEADVVEALLDVEHRRRVHLAVLVAVHGVDRLRTVGPRLDDREPVALRPGELTSPAPETAIVQRWEEPVGGLGIDLLDAPRCRLGGIVTPRQQPRIGLDRPPRRGRPVPEAAVDRDLRDVERQHGVAALGRLVDLLLEQGATDPASLGIRPHADRGHCRAGQRCPTHRREVGGEPGASHPAGGHRHRMLRGWSARPSTAGSARASWGGRSPAR